MDSSHRDVFCFIQFAIESRKEEKEQFEHLFEKTSTRDWGQVAANGGIAGILILVQYALPNENFYPAYLGRNRSRHCRLRGAQKLVSGSEVKRFRFPVSKLSRQVPMAVFHWKDLSAGR